MLEIVGLKQNLIIDPPVINAPGVWMPESLVPTEGLGALVTPLLGWHWDGEPAPFAQYPGAFLWAPPRRQIERFFRRLRHTRQDVPLIAALALDEPAALADAAEIAEMRGARAVLLWDGPSSAQVAATAATTLLPVLVEYPAGGSVPDIDAAVAGVVIGPPRARLHGSPARLWGPAMQPLVRDSVRILSEPARPVIAAGVEMHPNQESAPGEAGVDGICVGPEVWVRPDILVES